MREAQVRPDPAKAPLSRFTLVRLDDAEHAFVWSVPDLHLDGWSWPIVFLEVAEVDSGRGKRPRFCRRPHLIRISSHGSAVMTPRSMRVFGVKR